jgi:hypothetical protein
MTFTIDPNLIENNEVRLTEDGNGELAIEHISTGNTITVDQNVAISDIATDKLPSNLDAQGNDINNVGSVNTDVATIENIQVTQDNIQSLTKHSGHNITAGSSDEFLVVFDLASPVDILSGAIIGPLITQIRFTWDDGTTDNIGARNFGAGQTSSTSAGGDAHRHDISPVSVPSAKGVTKLEFRVEEQADYGFEVYST